MCSCFIEFIKQVGKSDKMRGLLCILLLFCNKFNKFNNIRAQMSDSIYDITTLNFISGLKG